MAKYKKETQIISRIRVNTPKALPQLGKLSSQGMSPLPVIHAPRMTKAIFTMTIRAKNMGQP
jgi:hypothetical protein